ncbi:NAD(P)H-binding protein [Halocatena pleomorpha]|uniref:NAD-dependent epimerase/dehydratase family protein n=1 Tax=Halocatena pleomorpha TaxID=1785090 RepID=A0A3P3RCR3_9EURY|nr:NAD(P)H-binding protein [Halocatena pleomorpha]RRJ31297.1 NAD-dependent epimerase/dehydratase family protein [Halocatena pleomorpha]
MSAWLEYARASHGATGFVGSRLVPALLDDGHDVVALVRDRHRYDPPAGVTVMQGDLLDENFEHALSDVAAAYYLVHSMRDSSSFAERDRSAARNFVRAASESDIERVVYLSGLGSNESRLSNHLRSRREVERILKRGTYDLTTLRAAIIVGNGSAGYEILRQLGERYPVLIAPKGIDTRCQPIAVDDAIEYLTGVLSVPETADDTFEIGGPDVLTYREILIRIGRATQHRAPIIVTLPVDSALFSGRSVALLTGVSHRIVTPLLDGLDDPVVVTDTRIQSLVPIDRTPFTMALERTIHSDDPQNQ